MVSIMTIKQFMHLVIGGVVSDKTGQGHLCSEDGNYHGAAICVDTIRDKGLSSIRYIDTTNGGFGKLTHVYWCDNCSDLPKEGMPLFMEQLKELLKQHKAMVNIDRDASWDYYIKIAKTKLFVDELFEEVSKVK